MKELPLMKPPMRNLLWAYLISDVARMGGALFVLFVTKLGASIVELGLVLSAGGMGSILGSIPAGILSDRFGARRTISLYSFFLPATCFLLLGFTEDLATIAVLWATISFGWAGFYPATTALISSLVPRNSLGKNLGFLNSADMLFGTFGFLFASLLAQYLGFSILFLIMAAVRYVSGLVVLRVVEKPRVALAVHSPKTFRILMSNQPLMVINITLFALVFVEFGSKFYARYVTDVFNPTPFQMGLFDVIYSLMWGVTQLPFGMAADRIGRRQMILMGYLMMALPWMAFPFATSMDAWYVLWTIFSVGNSMGYFVTVLAVELAPQEYTATAMGVLSTFIMVGYTISTATGGYIIEALGFPTIFAISALSLVISGLVILFLTKAKPQQILETQALSQ